MTGSIFLGSSSYAVNEQEGTLTVTIERTGDLSGPVTVQYATNPDSASQALDFLDADGSVTIPAGVNQATIVVSIVDDALSEPTENFNFSLISVSSGALLFPRTANIRILDDENPVTDPVDPPQVSDFDVTTQSIVTDLSSPLNMEWLPGSANQALVAEQGGRIKLVDTQTGSVEATLLDISLQTNHNADRGLMDIAIHPDFDNNPYIYLFHVVDPPESDGASGNAGLNGSGNRYAHVVRYEMDTSGAQPVIDETTKTILVGGAGQSLSDIAGNGALNYTQVQHENEPASDVDPVTGEYKQDYIKVDSQSHAGGALAFGPDGALYISTGDGVSFDFADARADSVQSVDALAGKILRVDPLTGDGLADNPFVQPGDDLSLNSSKVFQMGLRNPYVITFAEDGRLFISETGWFSSEEINQGAAGANFGWPYFEGGDSGILERTPVYENLPNAAAFYTAVDSDDIDITAAYRAFSHLEADPGYSMDAIVGSSSVYTGDQYPNLFEDDYFFLDIVDRDLFSVDINDRTQLNYVTTLGPSDFYVNFVQGPDGYMYGVHYSGSVDRIEIVDPNPANSAPFVTNPIEAQIATTGDDFGFQVPANAFVDPDSDTLQYTAALSDGSALPAWLSFDGTTGAFSGTPGLADQGSFAISVAAFDPEGLSAADVFQLQVAEPNSAPVLTNPAVRQIATGGEAFTYALPADMFVDDDAFTRSATQWDGSALPGWLGFDPQTGTFTGSPTNGDAGMLIVTVSATDSIGQTSSDSFLITVLEGEPEPDAPVLDNPIADLTTTEEAPFSYTIPANTFSDPNGDALTYSVTNADGSALAAWLSFDAASRTLSGTPDDPEVGTENLRVTATDPGGLFASDNFDLTTTAVNDAPVVASPVADQSAQEGSAYSFLLPAGTFTDADDASLTLSASQADGSALPAWLSFNPATGAFSGTPGAGDTGAVDIRVTATDSGGLAASDDFVLTVGAGTGETLYQNVPGVTQYLTGTTENDIFVIDAPAAGFGWDTTQDGTGIVVWGAGSHDILTNFEAIRFNDITIPLVQTGNVYSDVPGVTQFLTGQSADDTFVIDGNSADYGFDATQDTLGVVVWTDGGDHDILYDFENLQFNDTTIVLADFDL
ncbi:putative Ig domain-containing protein [Salaquimonas pukyongi]|uniref:putative Ig domain-containing protein n=1 Tax=Salaquimonas pukyongi TaxID=2712698 RepID=UPI00096BCEF8|nr:putative Ig domain-containing protein [Salaquimonas pukyongi]